MTPNSQSRAALLAPLALLAAGCELKVTNPGPVQADFLETSAALTSVVNGAGRDLGEAINWTAYTGAAVAKELFPAGSTAAFGISVRQQAGKLTDDDGNAWWNNAQRARWTAENSVDRIKRVLGADAGRNATLAQALVWAGYANRHLGENFCEGIIDGSAPGPATVYFERAEAHFTEAIAVATAAGNAPLLSAATAGRASVRLSRNNLAGAATDAAAVPNAFAYRMPYYQNDDAQYNRVFWSSANQPYRAHTVFNTFYEGYRRSSRDPRVPYDSSATVLLGDAAVTYNGVSQRVRWYFQTKHASITAPINLSTGWEMRLVEAEVRLAGGDVPGALALMNQRRTALSLPLLTASTVTEGWTLLKRERGIELWLESRRLGDFRRWAANARPGTSDDMTGRDLCFATALSEKQSNPNYGG
jgi:hypothetical protein